jgi:uncharacterized membrane protein
MTNWYFLKTKIFWFNLLALLVIVANAFGFSNFEMSEDVQQIATVIIILVNLISKYFDKRPNNDDDENNK